MLEAPLENGSYAPPLIDGMRRPWRAAGTASHFALVSLG
jgi:hypothetical protein